MSSAKNDYIRPVDFKHGRVDMTNGGGGRAMAQLIDGQQPEMAFNFYGVESPRAHSSFSPAS